MKRIIVWIAVVTLILTGVFTMNACNKKTGEDGVSYQVNLGQSLLDDTGCLIITQGASQEDYLKGLTITKTAANGESAEISVEPEMVVAPINTEKVGTQLLQLNYSGKIFPVPVIVKYKVDFVVDGVVYQTFHAINQSELNRLLEEDLRKKSEIPETDTAFKAPEELSKLFAAPEKPGYTFAGWREGLAIANKLPPILDRNITLTAIYNAIIPELSNIDAVYGDKLAEIQLPYTVAGEWRFKNAEGTVGNATEEGTLFDVVFVEYATGNVLVEDQITVYVEKKTVTFSDIVESFVYNGNVQIPTFRTDVPELNIEENFEKNFEFYRDPTQNYTNVGTYEYGFVVVHENYKGMIEGTYEIKPLVVTVTIQLEKDTVRVGELPEVEIEILGLEGLSDAEIAKLISITNLEEIVNGVGNYTVTATTTNDNIDLRVTPVTLTVYAGELVVEPPVLNAIYGDKLADVLFPDNPAGWWEWETPNDVVGNVGEQEHFAVFVPREAHKYDKQTYLIKLIVEPRELEIKINERETDNEAVYVNYTPGTAWFVTHRFVDKNLGASYVDPSLKVYYTYNGVDYENLSFINAGVYEIKVTLINGENYKSASTKVTLIIKSIDPELEIDKSITETWKPGLTLGQIALPTVSGGRFVWGDWTKNEDGSGYKDGSSAAGTSLNAKLHSSTVATFIPDDEVNYNRVIVAFDVNVNQATPVIQIESYYEFTYSGNAYNIPKATVNADLYVDTPVFTYTYKNESIASVTDAGTYVVVVTLLEGESGNYTSAQVEFTVTVKKADPEKPTQRWNVIYGDLVFDKITLPEHAQGTWSLKDVDATTKVGAVGQQTFTAIFTPTTGNYNSIEVPITVVVAKKTISVPSISEPNKAYTGALLTSGLTSAEGYTVVDNGGINVGTYYAQIILDTTSYEWNLLGTEDTFELSYNIIPADNAWNVQPTIKTEWTYGDIDGLNEDALAEYKGIASALHGTVTVLYASKNDGSFSTTFPTNAGQYTAKFIASDSNHNDLVATIDFTIHKQTVNVPTYTDAYVYTGSDITADIPTSALYDIEGNVAKNVGSYTATLTLKDSANYQWSNGNSNALSLKYTIAKASVAISVTVNGWTYGQAVNVPVVTVTKNFSDDISYTVQYSVDGTEWGTEIPVNAGTYTVRATVADADNYIGAEATCTLIIAKASVTISGANDSYNKTYDGNEFTITGVTASNGDTVKTVITKNGEVVDAIIGVGEYIITYNVAEATNYLAATKEVAVTVNKADVTISAPVIEGWKYGESAKAPSAVFDQTYAQGSNGQITFKYFTDANCTNEITSLVNANAGTYYVKAVFAGNDNLNAAQSASTEFVIAKATVEIPSVSDKEYNGQNQTSGLAPTASDLYTIYEDNGGTEHGMYQVTLQLKDSSNYVWDTSSEALIQGDLVTIEYEILIAVNKWIEAPAIDSWTFGDAGNAGTAKAFASEQLIIEYKLRGAENSTYTTTLPTAAGDYVARFTAKDSNYKDLVTEVQFTIYKKTVVAPTDYTKEYTYTGSDITAAIPTSDLYTVSNNVAKVVGNYSATLTLKDGANYKWSDSDSNAITVSYSITKASVTLSGLTLSGWTYGQAANTPTVTISKNFADTVTASFEYLVNGTWGAAVPTGAGTYTVKAEVAGTANYNGAEITLEFTIDKAGVTIDGANDSYTKDYDGNAFTLTGITASNGATVNKVITKNGETVDAIIGAGTYVITYTVEESANYNAATRIVNVTVDKADVTISTPVIDGWTYSETAKTPSAGFNETFAQSSNSQITFKYFTDPACTSEITAPVNAGTYYAKAIFAENDNLNGTESEATSFVIAKKVIATPTVDDKVYNGESQTTGLTSDIYTVTEVGGKDVADYTVTITLNAPANYAWDSIDNASVTTTVTYSITKASVSFDDLTITGWESGKYDATQNKPSVTVVKGFTDDVTLSFEYYINGEWGTTIPTLAGDYAVRVVVVGTNNYNGATTNGLTFKVTVAEVKLPSVGEGFAYTGSAQKPAIAESVYYTVVGNTEQTAVGTYSFTIVPTDLYSFVWAGEDVEATTKTLTYTIQKASVTLSGLTMNNWTYNETASTPDVTVTKSFTDAVTARYEYYDMDGNLLNDRPTNAGTYKVKAIVDADANGNYNGATLEKEFTINKASATLSTPTFTGGNNGKFYLNQIKYSTNGLTATHAGQTIAGTFAFAKSFVFVAGTNTSYIELTFTPEDTENYEVVIVKCYANIVTVAINDTTGVSYGSIETALAAAVSGNTVRVLPHDADLGPIYIRENVEIKTGVTLLLPYGSTASDSNTWKNDQPNFDLHGGLDNQSSSDNHGCEPYEGRLPSEKYDATYNPDPASKCIVKVVLAQGMTITNKGTLAIAGELSGGGQGAPYAGHTAGKHATLYLESDATIVSESGSKIYAAGFIREAEGSTGSKVIINSGATLFQPFVIKDYIDGNQMAALEGDMGDPHWTAPFTRFVFMNVSPELTVNYGGEMKVWAALYTQTTGASNITTVSFIGSGGVILLDNENSKLVAKYDVATEICDVKLYGGAKIGSIHLKLTLVLFSIDANTKNCLFPLTYHFRVTLCDGNYTAETTQGFKMMPGSVLIVEEDAKLTIDRVFIYETFIDEVQRAGAELRYPTTYADGTPLPAAKLIINGEFVCNTLGGKIYSQTEGAKVTVNKAVTFTSYEPVGIKAESVLSNYVTSWNTFTQNAVLVHSNNTTVTAAPVATYTYTNGIWVALYVSFDANGGSEQSTIAISDVSAYPSLPVPTKEGYEFLGWYAGDTLVSTGDALQTFSNHTLTARWKVEGEVWITVGLDNNGDGVADTQFSINPNDGLKYPELPVPAQSGYKFKGWYLGDVEAVKDGELLADGDHILTAKWAKCYTITITTNNATVSGVANGDQVAAGDTVSVTVSFDGSKNKSLTYNGTSLGSSDGTYSFTMPEGDVTINATSDKSSICLAPDTLITLADGTKKAIKDVRVGDEVLAWNFYTGQYEIVPVSLLQAHDTGMMDVLHLYFEDGTVLKVLGEHGIYDADLNTFIFIDTSDVESYLGHSFIKQDGDGFSTVKLVDYEVTYEYTTAYTILSYAHHNVMAEGMFTVTPAHVGGNFFNPFWVGEDMKYDEAQMQADIEKYGLYTYEDFDHVLTYEQFVALNIAHFKVSVEKGYITYEGLIYLIEGFINNEDFDVTD